MVTKRTGGSVKRKAFTIITLIAVLLQCSPTVVWGLDFNLRDSMRSVIERRNQALKTLDLIVNDSYTLTSEIVTGLASRSFSALETRIGLNESNLFYAALKNNSLQKVGFYLGGAEGVKDFGLFAVDALGILATCPADLINLGYNVEENPERYKKKLMTGATYALGVLANPRPIINSVSANIKTTLTEANADPLKRGKLQGEIAVGVGLGVVLGVAGTSVKSASLVSKLEKLTPAGRTPRQFVPKLNFQVCAIKVQPPKGTTAASPAITAPTRVIPSQKIISNTKVGDLFDGVKITKIDGNRLTLANGNKLYENVRLVEGEDVLAKVDLAKFTPRNNLLVDELGNPANGRFLYVIDRKGSLLMTKAAKGKFHSQLVQGKPVKYAGEIFFKDGSVTKINRVSGHYLPTIEDFDDNLPIFQKNLPGVTRDLFSPDLPDWVGVLTL